MKNVDFYFSFFGLTTTFLSKHFVQLNLASTVESLRRGISEGRRVLILNFCQVLFCCEIRHDF